MKKPTVLPSLVTLICALFLLVSPSLTANTTINWSSDSIQYHIGDGSNISEPVVRSFTSSKRLQNISISVVPELEGFVSVEPSQISLVEPNVPYDLKVTFSVPPRASEGDYTGTLHIKQQRRTIPQVLKINLSVDYGDNIVSDSAKVLSEESVGMLESISIDRSLLVFSDSTPELLQLQNGDVIVLPDSPSSPGGFLGIVEEVIESRNRIFVTTTPGALTDLFDTLSLSFAKSLTIADLESQPLTDQSKAMSVQSADEGFYFGFNKYAFYDDGHGKKVTATGRIWLDDLSINGGIDLSWGGLDDFWVGVEGSIRNEIELNATLGISLDKEKVLKRFYFGSITIYAGWVPIVFTPQFAIKVGIDGEVSAGFTVGVEQSADWEVSLSWKDGADADWDRSWDFETPRPTISADAKGYLGGQFSLLLYGFVGQYVELRPYGKGKIDIYDNPDWKIYVGVEGAAGLTMRLFDPDLSDVEYPAVLTWQKLIATGNFNRTINVRAGEILSLRFKLDSPFAATPTQIRGGIRPYPDDSSGFVYEVTLYDSSRLLGSNDWFYINGNAFGWGFSSATSGWPDPIDFSSIYDRSINGRFEIVSDKDYSANIISPQIDLTNCRFPPDTCSIVGQGTVTGIYLNGLKID